MSFAPVFVLVAAFASLAKSQSLTANTDAYQSIGHAVGSAYSSINSVLATSSFGSPQEYSSVRSEASQAVESISREIDSFDWNGVYGAAVAEAYSQDLSSQVSQLRSLDTVLDWAAAVTTYVWQDSSIATVYDTVTVPGPQVSPETAISSMDSSSRTPSSTSGRFTEPSTSVTSAISSTSLAPAASSASSPASAAPSSPAPASPSSPAPASQGSPSASSPTSSHVGNFTQPSGGSVNPPNSMAPLSTVALANVSFPAPPLNLASSPLDTTISSTVSAIIVSTQTDFYAETGIITNGAGRTSLALIGAFLSLLAHFVC